VSWLGVLRIGSVGERRVTMNHGAARILRDIVANLTRLRESAAQAVCAACRDRK